MSREVIAVVRLAYGEVGYYDELSRIHLTAGSPQKEIFAGTNCAQLRRSVKSGRLRLLSGSLGEERKLDFAKKGNKFTGAPQVDIPVQVAVIPETAIQETPVTEVSTVDTTAVEASAAETHVTEGSIIEAGVIEIEAVNAAAEEVSIVEDNTEAVETVVAEENTKKTARKKAANKQEVE